MSQLNVDNIQNRTGSNGGPNFPSGISVAVGQTAYIHGNLQVDGTETIINTETLNVADKTVGIGSTSNASNTTADGSGIEIFASSSQTGNNKTLTWSNTANSWEFGPNDVGLKVGTGVTINSSGVTVTGVVTATSFKGDGSQLSGIDATAIQTGNTSVQTVDTGSDGHVKMTTEGGERVRIGPAGQIGLGGANYGSSGQLLTSGGSGSAPTWTTVSSAPEITGTVTGTLPNGVPVIVHTDGTIKKAGNEGPTFGTHTNFDSDCSKLSCTQMNGDRMCVVYINGSNQLEAVIGDVSGTSITFGTATNPSGYGGDAGGVACQFTTGQSGRVVVIWYNSSNDEVYVTSMSVGSSGTNATWNGSGGVASIKSNGSPDCLDVTYGSSNKFIFMYSQGSSPYPLYVRQCILQSNGTFASWTSQNQVDQYVKHAKIANRPGLNSYGILIYVRGGQNELQHASFAEGASGVNLNTSSTVIASRIGTNAALPYKTAKPNYINITPNPIHDSVGAQNIFGYAYLTEPSSGTFELKGGLMSVNAASGSITTISNATIESARRMWIGLAFDNINDQVTSNVDLGLFYSDYNSPYYGFKTRADVTVNGTSSSLSAWDTPSTLVSSSCTNTDVSFTTGNTFGGKILFVYRGGATTSSGTAIVRTPIESNLTAENYIGYSNGSFTNGQTGTVKVVGNVATGLSGLTPGQTYYLHADGTLNLSAGTPSIVAGTAITSTSLLIKG